MNKPMTERDSQLVLEEKLGKGLELATKAYPQYTEGLGDWDKSVCALLMGNMQEYFDSMQEATKVAQIGDFEKFAFPIVRALMPQLAAQDLVTVQAMDGPVSLVFYLDFIYGSTKGAVTSGSKLFESPNADYSSETIDSESIGTGDGNTAQYTGNLTYLPVKAGTITITDGTQVVTDDGAGALIGDVAGGGNNTINYTTGAYDVTFTSNVGNGTAITVAYDYDMEMNDTLPEIDLLLTSAPVTARINKLRTRWGMEAAYNLQKLHGLIADVELTAAITHEVKFEIDSRIVRALKSIALDGPGSYSLTKFDRTPPTGVSWRDHKEGLVDAFIETSTVIFQQSGRATGTWVVAGAEVTNIIESLAPRFVRQPGIKYVRGVHKFGTLDAHWDVYKDPQMTAKDFLIGYKGPTMLETGYIYAPYLPLFTTNTIMLDDFINRRGLATMFGTKAVNSKFYCKSAIVRS